MKVLLIEPDKVLAQTYVKSLKKAGHEVHGESSAQGAIEAIDKNKPDSIVLEVQLAGHSGVEFLFELRSYSDLGDIPVILLTTVPEHELGLSSEVKKQLGITHYLYKPHTSLQKLNQILAAGVRTS